MKLWLLRPIHTKGDDPWNPWYDCFFGFVIRAPDQARAREMADAEGGSENWKDVRPWLSSKYSTCVELTASGPEEIVIHDLASA